MDWDFDDVDRVALKEINNCRYLNGIFKEISLIPLRKTYKFLCNQIKLLGRLIKRKKNNFILLCCNMTNEIENTVIE